MIKILFGTITAFIVVSAAPSIAADAAMGRAKSAICAACHGANGISVVPSYPNLAGQKQEYLSTEMKKFISGSRPSAIYGPIMKTLSDQDVSNLAAYYTSLRRH